MLERGFLRTDGVALLVLVVLRCFMPFRLRRAWTRPAARPGSEVRKVLARRSLAKNSTQEGTTDGSPGVPLLEMHPWW